MISQETLGLALFAFVTSVTPGPNNLMLMASGANYGFRRTVPHMLGVGLGFTFMVAAVGLGIAGLIASVPMLETGLKGLSVVYLLYLAWRIANAAPPREAATRGRPMTFLEAASFQWVNPKAWAMALGAVSLYAPSHDLTPVLLVALVFGAVNLPSVSVWVTLGQGLRRWLTTPGRLRAFNVTMAVLLLASLATIL